ncbi:hypothetical protein [Ferruginibacter sp.]
MTNIFPVKSRIVTGIHFKLVLKIIIKYRPEKDTYPRERHIIKKPSLLSTHLSTCFSQDATGCSPLYIN